MSAHNRTVPRATSTKAAHNERVRFHDEDESALLGFVLSGDKCFQAKAQAIAAAPAEARLATAQREAKSYTPYGGRKRGAHRELIVHWLLRAADQPWEYGENGRRTYFANLPRRAHWPEDELAELDGRRIRERWPTLYEGAKCLRRFGGFRCIGCGTVFAKGGRYECVPLSNRPSRRYHCDACKCRLGSLTASQVESMRKALDAATGQRRSRRAARRVA
jgi:uncharacterized protein YlaI